MHPLGRPCRLFALRDATRARRSCACAKRARVYRRLPKLHQRPRRSDDEAMRVIDAQRALAFQVLWSNNKKHKKGTAHSHNDLARRRHHGAVDLVFHHATDQLARDLHVIHRELLEMQERGEAAAEIVERDAAPEFVRGSYEAGDAHKMLHRDCLGDLETHLPGLQRAGLDLLQQEGCELFVTQGVRREIDADTSTGRERGGLAQRAQGRADDPAIELAHHPITFGRRNEGAWQHYIALAVDHAQQHLVLGWHLFACRIQWDDGLAIQTQAAIADGAAQFVEMHHADGPLQGRLFIGGADEDAVAAHILGDITGLVGAAQQSRRVAGLGGNGHDADARTNLKAAALPQEMKFAHTFHEALGDLPRLFQRTVVQEQTEFVAAEACEGIAFAHAVEQECGDVAQEVDAGEVAGRVVDDLEAVEVVETGRVLPAVFLAAREGLVETLFEFAPIDEAGQGVVLRVIGHLLGRAPLLRDVAEDDDDAERFVAAPAYRRGMPLDGVFRTVPIHQQNAAAVGVHRGRTTQARAHRIGNGLPRLLVHYLEYLLQ